jgi:hypothetical protein
VSAGGHVSSLGRSDYGWRDQRDRSDALVGAGQRRHKGFTVPHVDPSAGTADMEWHVQRRRSVQRHDIRRRPVRQFGCAAREPAAGQATVSAPRRSVETPFDNHRTAHELLSIRILGPSSPLGCWLSAAPLPQGQTLPQGQI